MTTAPFPYDSLPKVPRAELRSRTELAAALRSISMSDFATALEELAGVPVRAWVNGLASRRAMPLTIAFADGAERTYVLEAELALARELIGRIVKQPARGVTDPNQAVTADVHGAFAAIAHHALRRSGLDALTIVNAKPDGPTCALTVSIAGSSYAARLTLPRPTVHAPIVRDGFAISLPVVAASVTASRADVEALVPGDVFLAPGLRPEGPVALIAPNAEHGLVADLAPAGRLVLRPGRVTHPFDMNDSAGNSPTSGHLRPADVALDAPVVVRVELGVVELSAREWSTLADGDVLSLGKKLGEPVALRVAGAEVARGELVQIDGEFGVRILSTTK